MNFTPIRINHEQAKQIHTLVRTQCCNYNDGNCSARDNGQARKCLQMISVTTICDWFTEAVLPLNPELQKDVFKIKDVVKSKCKTCGKPFVPNSNSAKFCKNCVLSARRKTQAEYAKKKRINSRQIEVKCNVYR